MESLARRAWRLRMRPTVTDPWTLVVCAGGGGIAWAIGTPAPLAAAVAGAMLATAAIAAVFRPGRAELPAGDGPALRQGTEQAGLISALEGYLGDLRRIRHSAALPESLTDSAIEALVAADGAREVAVRVARAVDGFDEALARMGQVAKGPVAASPEVQAAMQRMQQRRAHLLNRLRAALTDVAEVHAKLLELSATAELPMLPGGEVPGGVDDVNRSLDALRELFAQLDADARGAQPLG